MKSGWIFFGLGMGVIISSLLARTSQVEGITTSLKPNVVNAFIGGLGLIGIGVILLKLDK